MIICICHRVSDRDIAREVAGGCTSFDELQEATRVATGCGACGEFAYESFVAHAGVRCRARRCSLGGVAFQATQPASVSASAMAPTPVLAAG